MEYDLDNLDEKTAAKYSSATTPMVADINSDDLYESSNPDRPILTYEFLGSTKPYWRWTKERMEEATTGRAGGFSQTKVQCHD